MDIFECQASMIRNDFRSTTITKHAPIHIHFFTLTILSHTVFSIKSMGVSVGLSILTLLQTFEQVENRCTDRPYRSIYCIFLVLLLEVHHCDIQRVQKSGRQPAELAYDRLTDVRHLI